jgi:hypothetical protein
VVFTPSKARERGELAVVIKKNSPIRENSFKKFEAYMRSSLVSAYANQ